MASAHSAVRKALRGLEDGLAVFTGQLAAEAAELRRNVESRPRTGATYYRNILEDLQQRLEGVGQDLAALEAVSTEAVSLEELVGHSVALYCQNAAQIQELEARLAQFGYRDLFAPLPPENPLDMLELANGSGGGGGGGSAPAGHAAEYEGEEELCEGSPAPAPFGAGDEGEALGEVTNRLASTHLNASAAGAACESAASPAAQQQQRWGGGGAGMAGGGQAAPRTTIKAMAPMTAAKALMRDDTPSSLASPEALSPSMRELLGKYAASSGHATAPRPSTAGGLPSARPGSGSRGASPPLAGVAQATPPVPAYLSPAFQLAAMEQEVQMAHAETAAAVQAGGGGTPAGQAGWQADDAMYDALTATAKKLAGKPSFMDAYRAKFPAIVASTERLLQTVEKQRRPAAAAAIAHEEASAGPVAALAMAVQAAAGLDVSHGQQQQAQQQQDGAQRWQGADEESTLDLMAQVLHSRRMGEGPTGPPADSISLQFAAAGGAAGPVASPRAAAPAAGELHAPSTAALLSRAMPGGPAGPSAGAGKQSDPPPSAAPAAGPSLLSVPRSERSKPQLEEAIAAALRRGTTQAAPPASAAAAERAAQAASTAASAAGTAPASPAGSPPAPTAAVAEQSHTGMPAPAPPPSALRATACPPPPPAAAPAAAPPSAGPSAPLPPLRPVEAGEFSSLPTFIRSQLPLEQLNAALAAVHGMAAEAGSNGFTMEDVQATGLAGAKHKVVVNSLVKLGRVQLHVGRGGGQPTLYLLV